MSRARIVFLSLLLAQMMWQSWASATPQINWDEMLEQTQSKQTRESLEIDLRQRWESTVVGAVAESDDTPLDPKQIWLWPSQGFNSAPNLNPIALRAGERLITRMTVFSERVASDFSITVAMPRLDVVHVSYRYDNGAWTTLSAGDRIAMNRWPLTDRQPSFNVPLLPGQLDVVMQFAHRGILAAPVLLQNNRAFLEQRTGSIWLLGIFMGVNLVMALMGVLMALNFRKVGFLALSVMSFIMALVLMSSSGLGGMFVQTESAEFNDLSKFVVNTTWGAVLPLVAGIALGIQAYSARLWWASVSLGAVVFVCALMLADYDMRDSTPLTIGLLMAVVLVFVLFLLTLSWLKNYSRNWGITIGLLLYPVGLFLLFAAYSGVISTDASGKLASALCTFASLSMMRGLFLQHRMGRQIIARTKISPHRDVLTGLLNREGMQVHFYKMRERLRLQQTCAVFIYVSVLDVASAMDEHGEQGFEMGLVQIAASLSTSVTVTDGVGRISGHSFGITVLMPPDPAMASRTAQKILSRLMVVASHGAPMASSARIALAWMPLHGFRIDGIERRCAAALRTLEEGKRIGWVGGLDSFKEAAELLRGKTLARNELKAVAEPVGGQEVDPRGDALNLHERIDQIEREMLTGMDTQFLVEEADRLSQVLNSVLPDQGHIESPQNKLGTSPKDYQPTQQVIKSAAMS